MAKKLTQAQMDFMLDAQNRVRYLLNGSNEPFYLARRGWTDTSYNERAVEGTIATVKALMKRGWIEESNSLGWSEMYILTEIGLAVDVFDYE